ncbi:MAG: M23 family metallopeptidase [Clostridia bacterium]|nr:M23 family metallopeptidase [Clostridia bacterium]
MNKHDEINLRVISNIDEDIIDKNTEKRVDLFKKSAPIKKPLFNKRWVIGGSAVAAVLALIFIILPIFTRQVPVYQGMTVSRAPIVEDEDSLRESVGFTYLSNTEKDTGRDKHDRHDKESESATTTDTTSETDIGIKDYNKTYYAKPGEEVLITVHFDNPEKKEIISFTLNGEKYSSYMFEEGSDMEHLILKVKVGEEPGISEYTIDAIKYVDGTAIKDVRMAGDKTVDISIAAEHPTAELTDISTGFTSADITFDIKDDDGLIDSSLANVRAELYIGDELSATALPDGSTFKFSKLLPSTEYELRIIAEYDAFDEAGEKEYVILQEAVKTADSVGLSLTYTEDGVLMSTSINDRSATIISAKLERFGEITSLDPTTTQLLNYGTYTVTVSYTYDAGEGVGQKTHSVSQSISVFAKISDLYDVRKIYFVSHSWNPATQDYRAHTGMDLVPIDGGINVLSLTDGEVVEVYTDDWWGKTVAVRFTNVDGKEYTLYYQSLRGIGVKVGDIVKVGDKLGTIGNSAIIDFYSADHVHIVLKDATVAANDGIISPLAVLKR